MSLWKNLGRVYIVISVLSICFLAVKAVKYLPWVEAKMSGKQPSSAELNNVMKDLPNLEKILDHSPVKMPEAYVGLGVMYQQKGQLKEAEEMYRKTLEKDPDQPDALFRLGAIYQQQSKLSEAAVAFEHSLKKKPDFAQTHNNLGLVYDQMHRREEALKEFEEAVRLEPGNEVMKENLRSMQEDVDKQQKAVAQVMAQPAAGIAALPTDVAIDVTAPLADAPFSLRSPKRITLKNGRSIVGDIVEKDETSLWLEAGKGMKTKISRDEVERIEDT
jgi:tetratricopeptide (TPR) repeat protein